MIRTPASACLLSAQRRYWGSGLAKSWSGTMPTNTPRPWLTSIGQSSGPGGGWDGGGAEGGGSSGGGSDGGGSEGGGSSGGGGGGGSSGGGGGGGSGHRVGSISHRGSSSCALAGADAHRAAAVAAVKIAV